MFSENSELNLR